MSEFTKPNFRNEVRSRLARLNLEPTREAAIVEEMSQHLEQRFEDLVAKGTAPATACETVLKDLNEDSRLERDLLQVEKQVPLERALPEGPSLHAMIIRLAKDVRYA